MSHGDLAWVSLAVAEARRRAGRYARDDLSAKAHRARKEWAEIEEWERRRRGRAVRLWVAHLEIRTAACDAEEARCRLTGYLRRPYHRIGDTPGLYAVEQPVRCHDEVSPEEWLRLKRDYPVGVHEHGTDRTPYGAFEQAHVTSYVAALTTGRARLLAPRGERDEPALVARGPAPAGARLDCWQTRQRVHFLAGPLESSARRRADELAATIVDSEGGPLASVSVLDADDGFASVVDGHWVHPADSVGPFASVALWDDFDAIAGPADVGSTSALAAILGRAAVQVRETFDRDARLHAAPIPPGEARLSGLARAEEEARVSAAGKTDLELVRLADDADYLADRLDSAVDWDEIQRAEEFRRQAEVYRELGGDRQLP
ncbi:hypothetical protein ABZ639_25795 [Saccharomonospora sp. NPDC006951]